MDTCKCTVEKLKIVEKLFFPRIRGVERESVISSQRTLQADCSFVTADWQLCVAAKHGSLLAMCLRKASGELKTCQQRSRKRVEANTKKIYFVVW